MRIICEAGQLLHHRHHPEKGTPPSPSLTLRSLSRTSGVQMKNAVSDEFQLYGTGFTKVTFAIDNPTPTHKDFNNFGLTFLIAWDVSGEGEELIGGSHVVTDPVFGKAVVIKDSKGGVVIIGDYR